jgi:CspA family cold shock protein
MSQREVGHVKWFNEKKGFGFIVNDSGEDIFVHYKDIQGTGFKTLHEDDQVSFLIEKGPKGLKAQDVAQVSEQSTSVNSPEVMDAEEEALAD